MRVYMREKIKKRMKKEKEGRKKVCVCVFVEYILNEF